MIGCLAAGAVAFAATNWTVSLGSGSKGQAQSASVANLTISAVATPAATNLVYPGGYGDAVAFDPAREVEVLTPPSTVAALAAGYRPLWSAP